LAGFVFYNVEVKDMIQEYQISVEPRIAASTERIIRFLEEEKNVDGKAVEGLRILRRSIDARHRRVMVNLSVRVYVNEPMEDSLFAPICYKSVADAARTAVIVGAGPAGLFAALRLIEFGIRPIVLERGRDVETRRRDVAAIAARQRVDSESNYSFGEGGAGAFSDGKLYTRSTKRGDVGRILRIFCQHGASTSILVDVHPHLGTDRLPRIIKNMRETILRCGGEVYFSTKVTRLIVKGTVCCGVETVSNGEGGKASDFLGPVILATGHSARDIYRWLYDNGVEIEAKPLAVGVRLEHPAKLIDCIQYHSKEGRGEYLPTAEYAFAAQVDGRGVYSFCMCPGGVVVPAATEEEQVVVNGMSSSLRNSPWSNSGMVVEVRCEDLPTQSTLGMMEFQQQMEREAWLAGGRSQMAPAQRMADFVNGRISANLPRTSYTPGLVSSPLHFLLPQNVRKRLQKGFSLFGRNAHGFLTNEALLIGVETRTSSPIRILRQRDTLEHICLTGLYPCGEGAGYAGGIVSAAIDGERCAEHLANKC